MHQNPVFARQIASGRHGFPYKDTDGSTFTSPNYGAGALPRSEQLDREFIWFQFVNYPNTHEDMDDVVRAFHKVLGN